MIFAWDNKISGYTLTGSSDFDIYTIENIKDPKLEKIWKGLTVGATQRIVIDAGAAVLPELVAILGHNFTTETVSIQANDTDAWGAPAIDYEFPTIKDIMFYIYPGIAYRYWSILIENCVVPTKPPEIGYVHIGPSDTFTDPDSLTPSDIDDNSTFEKSETNTLYGTKGEVLRQNFQLNFTLLSEAEFTTLKTMFTAVGKALPFIVIWNATTDYVAVRNMYCSFITGFRLGAIIGYQVPSLSFTIEECR